MTGVIVTLVGLVLLGAPIAWRAGGPRPAANVFALAFLFGSGIAAVALLCLSVARIAWSLPLLLVVAVGIAACGFFVRRRADGARSQARVGHLVPAAAALIGLAVAVEHARFAVRAPLDEWDFLAIWGLKARTFLVDGGIDWAFLERIDNRFANPDYPPLLPLLLDAHALWSGWDGRWIGLFFTAFGLAAFVVAWCSVRSESANPVLLIVAAVLFAFPAYSNRIGLAEAPIIAFAVSAVVLIRQGLMEDDRIAVFSGGLLLGFAALTKNEGVALTAAVTIAAILFRPRARMLVAMVPGIALAVWWQVLRAMHELPTARASGSVLDRVSANLANFREWSPALWTELAKPAFWVAVLVLAAIAGARALWRERFLAVVVLLQCGAILGAYLVSHVNIRNEIVFSWERLSHQFALLAALLVAHALVSDERSENERGGPEPAS